MSIKITRAAYAEMFGPTTGDRVRLADTELWIEVEKDFTVYGEEVKFGGGKVIRDGMGQSQRRAAEVADTVITNALIVDHWGIVKADIGIKDGRISGIGKAGNPDIQPGVDIAIGAATEIIAGEGMIVTAGGIDAHIHFICPQQIEEALMSGVTTMIGGGTGPATGTAATTCTPGPWHIHRMLQAAEAFPMNLGFLGKGNVSLPDPLREQVAAGRHGPQAARGLGHHAGGDRQLPGGRRRDGRAGRDPHRYAERIGLRGNHAWPRSRAARSTPITPKAPAAATRRTSSGRAASRTCCRRPPIPTRPYTVNTIDEHLDMLMVCHHLDPGIAEDVAFAESRIRRETIAAEDILHDLGAFSMMSSDSQAMGRVGEVIMRTWQTAHKMSVQRGALPQDQERNDNFRVKRYIAKYTINPAMTHGIAHEVGSLEAGKLADLVLWRPAFFGVKPSLIIKGGMIAAAAMGDPERFDPDAAARALPADVRRLRQGASSDRGHVRLQGCAASTRSVSSSGLRKRLVAVKGTRSSARRTWCSTMPRRGSRSTPKPMKCAPTASCSPASRQPCCRWRNAIFCSRTYAHYSARASRHQPL